MNAAPADVVVCAADAARRRACAETRRWPIITSGSAAWLGSGNTRWRIGRAGLLLLLLLLALGLLLASSAAAQKDAADAPHQVHGEIDAFATLGAALAWGVLRGSSEAATAVVVRIVSNPALYPWLAAISRDPFTDGTEPLLTAVRNPGLIDVRSPRAHFADFPRTEFHFYDSEAAARLNRPALVVFFLGVPDTTPEFGTEEQLRSHLEQSRARLRGQTRRN